MCSGPVGSPVMLVLFSSLIKGHVLWSLGLKSVILKCCALDTGRA